VHGGQPEISRELGSSAVPAGTGGFAARNADR